jgi:hypothetical protein
MRRASTSRPTSCTQYGVRYIVDRNSDGALRSSGLRRRRCTRMRYRVFSAHADRLPAGDPLTKLRAG